MENRFYVKRVTVESRLVEYGFELAGEVLVENTTRASKYVFWFKEGTIIKVRLRGAMLQLVNNIAVYQIGLDGVHFVRLDTLDEIKKFLDDWKSVGCSETTTFLTIFKEFYEIYDTTKEKISKVLAGCKKLSKGFGNTFSVQFKQLSNECEVPIKRILPRFFTTSDGSLCKVIGRETVGLKDVVVYSEFGKDSVEICPIEGFDMRMSVSPSSEDVNSLVDELISLYSGIFEKTTIREYLTASAPYLANGNVLEEQLGQLPKYPSTDRHSIECKANIGCYFKLAEFEGKCVVLTLDTTHAFLRMRDGFKSDKSCLFEPRYIEKCLGRANCLVVACDFLYNVLSWFPEEFEELSNIVLKYLDFFNSFELKKTANPLDFMQTENPDYLKDSSEVQTNERAEKNATLQGIKAFDSSSMFGNRAKTRITASMGIIDIVTEMSDGNPGAVSVLTELCGMFALNNVRTLDSLRVYGSDIWVLFKDVCKEDFDVLDLVLQHHNYGKLTEEDIHAQIAKRAPFDKLMTVGELHADFRNTSEKVHADLMRSLEDSCKNENAGTNIFSMPTDEEEE